ncbi:MAG: efflux RND transporter periplasmic adaptor subunit [Phycisphaerales bacterium]
MTQVAPNTSDPKGPDSSESGVGAVSPSVAPSAGPPDPELLRFLNELAQIQAELAGAIAAFIFIGGAGGRLSLLARTRRLGARGTPIPRLDEVLASPEFSARMERVAGELCRTRALAQASAASNAMPHGRVEGISLRSGPPSDLPELEPTHQLVATPLVAEGVTHGATVLLIPHAHGSPDEVLTRLALTSARFEAFLWRSRALDETKRSTLLTQSLELIDRAQQGENARAMGALLCHELAVRFSCARVSIGLIDRDDLRVVAVSGADRPDRNAPATEALEDSMEECAEQDAEVVFPRPQTDDALEGVAARVTRAHEALSRKFGPSAILSLPLRVEGDLVGVVLLERDAENPFPIGSIALLRLVGEYMGPALWTRRLADRGVLAVTRDRALDLGAALVGPRHTAWKLAGLAAILLLVASLVPLPYSVNGPVEIRATTTRTISPPFNGFLSGVHVKPGDRVKSGDLLASMDPRDLEKEIAQTESRRDQLVVQRDQASQAREQAKAQVFQSQVDEADASLSLLRDQRDRCEIRAPMDATVGQGDLERFVGARVEPSQTLFELVDDGRRALVRVSEREIRLVRAGGTGTLSVRADPSTRFSLTIDRVAPVAEAVQGQNVYAVECDVKTSDPREDSTRSLDVLLPGMTGTARLDAGRRSTLSRLLVPLVDELRLRMWW